jgi:DNA-binding transcriptional MerR regulator
MTDSYKIADVCKQTDTQPYVIRFWESEFPQLAPRKNPSGQTVYTAQDVALIRRIKQLLYEEEHTIAGARERLERELRQRARPGRPPSDAARGSAQRPSQPGATRTEEPTVFRTAPETVDRDRYDGAVQEIQRLRRENAQLAAERDLEARRAGELERAYENHRQRADHVAARLEQLLDTIQPR